MNDAWGPTVEGSARLRRLRRWALVVTVTVLVVAVAFPIALLLQVPRTPVEGLAASTSPTHILVIGSDSREGLTREEQIELSTGLADEFEGDRTDTILLLSISGGDAAMLSFPRDLWVERCDGSIGRINVAYSLGGESCLVDTVRSLSGIDVQHTARVTFGGFRDLVDAVGGVELCLDEAIADRDAGIDLPAGCQRLDGGDALGFVRVRKIDDDLQRIQRQQQFVRALASEVARPATLLNPVRLWELARGAGDAVVVDRGFGPIAGFRAARGARALAGGDVPTYTVPADPVRTAGGADVLEPRTAEAAVLFARFRDGSVFTDGDHRPEPADVEVAVLNGAGVSGLAGDTADALRGRGYRVTDVGNADGVRETTLVRHPPDLRAEAELVAGEVPGAVEFAASEEVDTVTLILGRTAGDPS